MRLLYPNCFRWLKLTKTIFQNKWANASEDTLTIQDLCQMKLQNFQGIQCKKSFCLEAVWRLVCSIWNLAIFKVQWGKEVQNLVPYLVGLYHTLYHHKTALSYGIRLKIFNLTSYHTSYLIIIGRGMVQEVRRFHHTLIFEATSKPSFPTWDTTRF